jgi:hypothetical protein
MRSSRLPRLLRMKETSPDDTGSGITRVHVFQESWGSSVSIVTRLRDGQPRVQSPAGAKRIFSLRHRVQTGSGAHAASYPVGTEDSYPEGKTAEA